MLVTTHKPHKTDTILALGRYKLYDVKDESSLSDQRYLELSVGNCTWQGYLLPSGLPDDNKKRSSIIPTREVVAATNDPW